MNWKVTIVTTLCVIVIGVVIGNLLSGQKEPMKRMSGASGGKAVKTMTVRNEDIVTEIEISGPLSALDKIEIYAEVSGILLETPKRFKEGTRFSEGETLIDIDDAVYRNTVLAQKSSLLNRLTLLLADISIDFPQSAGRWEGYLEAFDILQPLRPLPDTETPQERYYIASRDIYSQFYTVQGMEETLAKYTITAPYNGIVSQSNINPGTLVRVGQKLGEFTNTDTYEMEAYVGIDEVDHLKIGQTVSLTSSDISGTVPGQVQRINAVIDPGSQTVKVYITARDPGLKDGMYLTARVSTDPVPDVFELSKELLVDHDKVYSIKDATLRLRQIEIIRDLNDRVIVRGLENGTVLLNEVLDHAREGMAVTSPAEKGGTSKGNHTP